MAPFRSTFVLPFAARSPVSNMDPRDVVPHAAEEIEAVDAPALGRFIQRDRFRPPCAQKHHLVSRHGIGRFGPIGPRVLETGRTDLGYAPVAGS